MNGADFNCCRQILAASGSNFARAFSLLRPRQRDALTAYYAFCRLVDDAVDGSADAQIAKKRIGAWRRRIRDAFGGSDTGHPVCEALARAASDFGISRKLLELMLDGVEQDIVPQRFATFGQLEQYCYRVACSVGLVCLKVVGAEGAWTERYAELSGLAVQMTNILRDLGEDARMGRVYLPLEDLRAYGVSERQIAEGRIDSNLERLLGFEIERTRALYRMAASSMPRRERKRMFFTEALRQTYELLLDRVAELGPEVLRRRARLGKLSKLGAIVRCRLLPAWAWRQ